MSDIRLAAPVRLVASDTAGSAIPKNHLVALMLEHEGIQIDTSRFLSRDLRSKKREGILRVRVNGQETVFPYSGEGVVHPKFRDKLIYLGPSPSELAFDVNLIELDEKARQALGTGASLMDLLARSPGGALQPALPAGLALGSALLRFIQGRIEDDEEAQIFWVHDERLRGDQILELELLSDGSDATRLRLVMRAIDLGAVTAPSRVRLRVGHPELEVEDQTVEVHRPHTGPGARKRSAAQKRLDAHAWLLEEDMQLFNFEARSGRTATAYTTSFAKIHRVLSWYQHDLFEAQGGAGPAGRHLVPLTLGFSLNTRDLNARELLDVAQSALDLAALFEPRVAGALDVLRKHGPTALGLISELTARNFSLFAFDGVLVLDPPGGNEPPSGGGRLVLPATGDGTWGRRIRQELTWRGRKVGSFAFDLEAKRAD